MKGDQSEKYRKFRRQGKREKAKIPARLKDCNAGREITWDAETDSECKVGSDRWWKG